MDIYIVWAQICHTQLVERLHGYSAAAILEIEFWLFFLSITIDGRLMNCHFAWQFPFQFHSPNVPYRSNLTIGNGIEHQRIYLPIVRV